MRLKRFAMRGLIILAVAVALCMFFANTIQTITTAKVKLTYANKGRFEDKMTLKAELVFPDTEEVTVAAAAKNPVSIEKVNTRVGNWVKEGTVIYTCSVTGYEEGVEKLRESYAAKNTELAQLDVENRKSSRESKANRSYQAAMDASEALAKAVLDAQTLAVKAGVTLPSSVGEWSKLLALMDPAPTQELSEAVAAAETAQSTYDAAFDEYKAVMEDRKQRVSSETFEYINKRDALMKEMNKLAGALAALTVACDSLSTITAPHSGYVTELPLAVGDSYDGKKAAFVITAVDTQPVLRASLAGIERAIADGTKGEITSDINGVEKVSVIRTTVDKTGGKVLEIGLPDSMMKEGNTAVRRVLNEGGTDVVITYRAKQASTLLPPSVVRADGDTNYVYVVETNYGRLFSSDTMKVVRRDVTVLDRSTKMISIEEDMDYQSLADREDRMLSDGQTVMEYVE